MSKLLVDEIGGNAAADTTIASGKKIAGTASQFKMTDVVQGDVLYGSAADTINRLAKGTAAQVLSMNSGATAPEWAASAAGGKILQIVSVPIPAITATTTSATYVDIAGMTLDITPSATTSNVLIQITMNISGNASGVMGVVRLLRDTTPIFIGDQADSNRSRGMFTHRAYSNQYLPNYNATFLDTAISTTSATTYKLQWAVETGGYYILLNVANAGSDILKYGTTVSAITLMEIGA